LFFGTAAGITPPVAIAAYAAAAIAGGKPIGTAISSTKVGAMIFIIPFAFVYNPILLGVSAAGVDFGIGVYLWAVLRLVLAMYLCLSALIGFDRAKLTLPESGLRLAGVILLFSPETWHELTGFALGIAMIALHVIRNPQIEPAKAGA